MASSALARRSLARLPFLSPSSSSSSSASHLSAARQQLLQQKRAFSATPAALARRTKSVMEENITEDDFFTLLTEPGSVEDSPSLGHKILMEKRRVLHYMRLIEHEMPKLVAYRKPFIPPTSLETPLYIKSVDYQGEAHPIVAKRSITVAVDDLQLDPTAAHTIKLLAGPRWTPNPPKDAGVMEGEDWGNGYIKVSCDTYKTAAQNLRWASDALGRLVESAKSKEGKEFADMPVDLRHVYAKARKGKKGDHLRDRALKPVSVKDFPKEWLPAGGERRV